MPGMQKTKAFVALTEHKRALEDELKGVKAKLDDLEPQVLEYMQRQGIQSIKVDSNTVYIRRDIRASMIKGDEALAEARARGLGDAITESIHASRAAAIVREFIDDPDAERPEWLTKVFNIYEGFKAGVRKG
jgi:hypothetical protein